MERSSALSFSLIRSPTGARVRALRRTKAAAQARHIRCTSTGVHTPVVYIFVLSNLSGVVRLRSQHVDPANDVSNFIGSGRDAALQTAGTSARAGDCTAGRSLSSPHPASCCVAISPSIDPARADRHQPTAPGGALSIRAARVSLVVRCSRDPGTALHTRAASPSTLFDSPGLVVTQTLHSPLQQRYRARRVAGVLIAGTPGAPGAIPYSHGCRPNRLAIGGSPRSRLFGSRSVFAPSGRAPSFWPTTCPVPGVIESGNSVPGPHQLGDVLLLLAASTRVAGRRFASRRSTPRGRHRGTRRDRGYSGPISSAGDAATMATSSAALP